MKRVKIIIATLLLLCSIVGCGKKEEEQEPKYFVTYGDTKITEEEYFNSINENQLKIILNEYEQEIVKEETKKHKKEIKESVNDLMDQLKDTYGDELEDVVKTQTGMTLKEYENYQYEYTAIKDYLVKDYLEENDLDEKYYEKYKGLVEVQILKKLRKKYKLSFENENLQKLYEKYEKNQIEEYKEYYNLNEENKEDIEDISDKDKIEDEEYKIEDLEEIKAQDIKEESQNEAIIVMIGNKECSHCVSYAPILAKVGEKYDIDVKYISLNSMLQDDEAYNIILELNKTYNNNELGTKDLESTPYTLFVKDNKILYYIAGKTSEENIEKALEKIGLK